MSLMRDVVPHHVQDEDLTDAIALARDLAKSLGLAEGGQFVLVVRGFDAEPARNTPSIRLLQV